MKDYTKATWLGARRGWAARRALCCGLMLLGALAAVGAGLAAPTRLGPGLAGRLFRSPADYDFSTWHFPVPAGDWLISRGPCGSGALYMHQCGYFEDECAFDLIPVSGSMQSVPVLAPQAGQVFFLGTRDDTGLAVFLQHDDGRISGMLHLSKVVVGLDQRVSQGQVLGYAGNTGDSGRAHVHFFVQTNAVERSCLPLYSLDEIDLRLMTVVSHNLPWTALTLADPPPTLPAWLPLVGLTDAAPGILLPARVVLPPAGQANLPIALSPTYLGNQIPFYDGRPLTLTAETSGYTVYSLPLTAPTQPGNYMGLLQFHVAGPVFGASPVVLPYAVRDPVDTSAAAGLVSIYPTVLAPPEYSTFTTPPPLCYHELAEAGPAPFTYRVMLSGSGQADSGWISTTCWTPPALATGSYFWKVFVRDGQGHMSRTNDHPHVFRIS